MYTHIYVHIMCMHRTHHISVHIYICTLDREREGGRGGGGGREENDTFICNNVLRGISIKHNE